MIFRKVVEIVPGSHVRLELCGFSGFSILLVKMFSSPRHELVCGREFLFMVSTTVYFT